MNSTNETYTYRGGEKLPLTKAPTSSWCQFQQSNSQVAPLAERRARYNMRLKIIGAMHRSGVRLLAGSDEPYSYIFPGFSLH